MIRRMGGRSVSSPDDKLTEAFSPGPRGRLQADSLCDTTTLCLPSPLASVPPRLHASPEDSYVMPGIRLILSEGHDACHGTGEATVPTPPVTCKGCDVLVL